MAGMSPSGSMSNSPLCITYLLPSTPAPHLCEPCAQRMMYVESQWNAIDVANTVRGHYLHCCACDVCMYCCCAVGAVTA